MLIGFYMCIILVPCFAVLALVFAVFKEKSAKLISGFNTLPKWKRCPVNATDHPHVLV